MRQVSIICPGSSPKEEFFARTSNACARNGFEAKFVGEMSDKVPYHSGSDEERGKALIEAFLDETSSVIYAKGGNGSARLLSLLKNLSKPNYKFFIGFSDTTSIHLYLHKFWNWVTIHGQFDHEKAELQKPYTDMIFRMISGDISELCYDLSPMNNIAERAIEIEVEGVLSGGNLSIIQTSIGTFWQNDFANKILFLEDIGECGYKVDRILTHLEQSEIFAEVKAIIFGDFSHDSSDYEKELNEFALKRFAQSSGIATYRVKDIGHGLINRPLILNSEAHIVGNELRMKMRNR